MINYDLIIRKGSIFKKDIFLKNKDGTPIDLTGFDARMQIRPSIHSSLVIADLTVGNGLSISGVDGQLTINIPDTFTTEYSKGVYDIELIDGSGSATMLIGGLVSFIDEVTR